MNIENWLADPQRSYADGLAIYNKFKKDNSQDSFFNSNENPAPKSIHFNLLIAAIQTVKRILEQRGINTKTIATEPGQQLEKRKFFLEDAIDVKSLPPDIQQRYIANQEITRSLAGLHQQLKAADSNQNRKELAETIAMQNKQRQENWKLIQAAAHAPDTQIEAAAPKQTTPSDALEMNRRMKTVQINISRAQREIQTAGLDSKRLKARKEKVKQWQQELADLQEKLKEITK